MGTLAKRPSGVLLKVRLPKEILSNRPLHADEHSVTLDTDPQGRES